MYYGNGCYPNTYGYTNVGYPYNGAAAGYGGSSIFAIILVLFILLVVVFGSRNCIR